MSSSRPKNNRGNHKSSPRLQLPVSSITAFPLPYSILMSRLPSIVRTLQARPYLPAYSKLYPRTSFTIIRKMSSSTENHTVPKVRPSFAQFHIQF